MRQLQCVEPLQVCLSVCPLSEASRPSDDSLGVGISSKAGKVHEIKFLLSYVREHFNAVVVFCRSYTMSDFNAYTKRFNRANVLVVGDAMLDRYVYGEVSRVSPEAPVPILTVTREAAMPGGAGNVVRNLIALDAAAAFVSVVGDDQAGSDLTGLIGGQERVEPWLLVQGGRTTTLKTRYIAQGQHLIRADREQTIPLPEKLTERLIRIALDAVAATSITLLSDYRKGVLSDEVAT